MAKAKRSPATPRKLPRQARSTQLVADVLQAAIRVLEREGAARFTTIRVAETAGVSVGSLYQYFPNKQAILYRLQVEEWAKTGAVIDAILSDRSRPPAARLRAMTRAFFRSECEEAPLRNALDLALDYHSAPESHAHREKSRGVVGAFVAEAAPRATPRQRRFAIQLLTLTMTSLGKEVSERRPRAAEVDRWADAVSQMLLAYLASLGPRPRASPSRRTVRG
jgi:AcrR family transcriptional regulator